MVARLCLFVSVGIFLWFGTAVARRESRCGGILLFGADAQSGWFGKGRTYGRPMVETCVVAAVVWDRCSTMNATSSE